MRERACTKIPLPRAYRPVAARMHAFFTTYHNIWANGMVWWCWLCDTLTEVVQPTWLQRDTKSWLITPWFTKRCLPPWFPKALSCCEKPCRAHHRETLFAPPKVKYGLARIVAAAMHADIHRYYCEDLEEEIDQVRELNPPVRWSSTNAHVDEPRSSKLSSSVGMISKLANENSSVCPFVGLILCSLQ